jgi:hypothetical protein
MTPWRHGTFKYAGGYPGQPPGDVSLQVDDAGITVSRLGVLDYLAVLWPWRSRTRGSRPFLIATETVRDARLRVAPLAFAMHHYVDVTVELPEGEFVAVFRAVGFRRGTDAERFYAAVTTLRAAETRKN